MCKEIVQEFAKNFFQSNQNAMKKNIDAYSFGKIWESGLG